MSEEPKAEAPTPPSPEDRLTALETKVSRLEATFKVLLGILRTMAKSLNLESDEGGFGLSKDESDQLDWLDELETDVDEDP